MNRPSAGKLLTLVGLLAALLAAPALRAADYSATASVSPASHTGVCPFEFDFSGTITYAGTSRQQEVQYKWIRSDGANSPVETLIFNGPGTRPVKPDTWTLGAEGHHWEAVEIVYPQAGIDSNRAEFDLKCVTPPKPAAKIVSVDCADGLSVKVHVLIDSPVGISSFSVWSTWGGGPPVDQTFAAPLPTHIDEVVTIAHSAPDPVDRTHQWGVKVVIPGAAAPILTYGMEPRGPDGKQRCPGHYRPPSKPSVRIVSVDCAGGLTVKVHVLIDNADGISSYSVWSTWGGGSPVGQTFPAPLPTHIDQVVTISHAMLDEVDRDHQWGLQVVAPGVVEPTATFAMEPKGIDGRQRCPGHYHAKPQATIVSVECADGLAVRVHILINSAAGIGSYSVWSTWGGGPALNHTFPAPLPTHVDEVVTISHSAADTVDRNHQWGLKVVIPGVTEPILTYGMEPKAPGGKLRCDGHYERADTKHKF